MNNKDISSKNLAKNNDLDSKENNKHAIYVDPNIGWQDGTSNYPFYTPPGEGHQPRITSS